MVQPRCPHSGPAFSAPGCTCIGAGLKRDSKRLCALEFSFSFCWFLSGALKRDGFRSGDISRVFGASTGLPFHVAHFLLPMGREEWKGVGTQFREQGKGVEKNGRR